MMSSGSQQVANIESTGIFCLTQQVETGKNVCIENESTEKILNDLSKAAFVKELIRGGMSFADALRELARRMRQLQGV